MLDNRETKKLLFVILAIIVLLGAFVVVRSCTKKDSDKEVTDKVETPNNTTTDDEDDSKDDDTTVEEEKPNDTTTNKKPTTSTNQSTNGSTSNSTETDSSTSDVENLPKVEKPVVTMETNYTVSKDDTVFTLPLITKDDNGTDVKVEVSYEFLAMDSTTYRPVTIYDSTKLGTYKVTYKISNQGGTIEKIVYVKVVDDELPVVSANTIKYETVGEEVLETIMPVSKNSFINDNVYLTFSDNDEIAYAEYYTAIKEIVSGVETIEEEAMANVVEIDFTKQLVLIEEGEYHIRVTDRSGNVTEFIVTIDKTPAVVEDVVSTQTGDEITVVYTFNEQVKATEGWTLSSDKKSLTKVYKKDITEEVIFSDLAGNKITEKVSASKTIKFYQKDTEIKDGKNINSNGKGMKLEINALSDGKLVITRDSDSENTQTYDIVKGTHTYDFTTEDKYFTEYGDYEFSFTDSDGNTSSFEVSISNLPIED